MRTAFHLFHPFLLAGFSVGLCASPLRAQEADPDSIVSANLARDGTIGAAVGVMRGADTLFFAAFGKADVETATALRTDAILGIGSITKQFTAAAILQLRDQGKLTLDDSISKWLPDFDTRGQHISLRRMLSHTSGLPDVSAMRELTKLRFLPLPLDPAAARDSMYVAINRHPARLEPGAEYKYSSAGYWLLHRVIEEASGMPYLQYLERMIFEPLGMKSSGVCYGNSGLTRRATGYGVRNGAWRRAPDNAPVFYLGSGDLCSTVADMLTWLQALHGGKVLSATSYAEMVKPATLADGTALPYGLGVDVRQDARGNSFIGHSGEITGYAARANWYPESGIAIVVLMNSSFDSSPTALVGELAARFIADPPATPPPARLAVPGALRHNVTILRSSSP